MSTCAWCVKGIDRALRRGAREERSGAARAARIRTRSHRQDGFQLVFLIVWDFIKYARDRDIPVGRAGVRPSARSFVLLKITDLDPISSS